MAVTCPVDLDTARLRNEIRSVYSRVAVAPDGEFHFHRGAAYAETFLHYDPQALARVPAFAVESFAGVGNPLRIEPIPAGATVIDVGCGAGTDLLLAANAVGPRGRAVGIDMTDGMLAKAEAAATAAGLPNVELRQGDVLELPVESACADFVISNGVLNLAPDKRRAFSEVARVLRPGGRFLYADIAVAATSSCGRVESVALCRRQSSCGCSPTSGSRASRSGNDSIRSCARRRRGSLGSIAWGA